MRPWVPFPAPEKEKEKGGNQMLREKGKKVNEIQIPLLKMYLISYYYVCTYKYRIRVYTTFN